MNGVSFKTLRGNAIYYTLDNRIELSNVFDKSKTFETSFEISETIETAKITKFVLELTQQCTMRCAYCCYSGKYEGVRSHSSASMSESTIDKAISFISSHYDKKAKKIKINFYGGEALIRFDEIQYVISKLKMHIDCTIQYSISTNGLGLNPNIIDWICSIPNIQVMLSVDGDERMHNARRKTIDGQGSYNRIISNLRYFKENYPDEYKNRIVILSTVKDTNEVLKLYDVWSSTFLADKYPQIISTISPIFSDENYQLPVISDIRNFYKRAFEQLVNGMDTILTRSLKSFISPLEERRFAILNKVQLVSSCLNDMHSCYIDAHGILYACEKVCSNQKIGSLEDGIDQASINRLNTLYVERLNNLCSKCWAMRLCERCLVNLNYQQYNQEKICNVERQRILLALQFYCLIKDLERIKRKSFYSYSSK